MLNQDYTKRVAIDSSHEHWYQSPADGVTRFYLERDDGGESAKATSLVRFSPGSSFETHTHDDGEEFFVLEGTFTDEHGHYPAGSYIHNPIGSTYTPGSDEGCLLFVKLRQFDSNDTKPGYQLLR